MRRLNLVRTILYDGFEDNLFGQKFSIVIEGQTIEFTADEISENRLATLAEKDLILKNSAFVVKTDFYITTEDRLGLYFFKTVPLLLIFSMGEFQPMRYKFYIEQVWRF